MVGSLSRDAEVLTARVLAPYLDDPSNCFVISSDFCHFGERFGFSPPHDPKHGELWQSIEAMDREGMRSIESGVCSSSFIP